MDAYERGARLAPAYLVFSPAVIFVVALSLGSAAWWSRIGGVLVACGSPALAAEWGRSGGREKEQQLFQQWGGIPTTKLLRFADGGSKATVQQRHQVLERATGISMPTQAEEVADPAGADETYGTAITALRELTRNEMFPLVRKENTSYGFRRNLWGRKPFGIVVAVAALFASGGLLVLAAVGHRVNPWEVDGFATAFSAIALVVWLTTITPRWVEEAAEAYAIRLLESAVRLPAAVGT